MPKAKVSKKPGSIMSYFEPVKLPRKLAKLENQSSYTHTTSTTTTSGKKTKPKPQPKNEKQSLLNWTLTGTLLKTQYKSDKFAGVPARLAVAAFDLDSTLVDTKSRTPFPRDGSDWRWLNNRIKPSLVKLTQHMIKDQELQFKQEIDLLQKQGGLQDQVKETFNQDQKWESQVSPEHELNEDHKRDQDQIQLSEQFSTFFSNAAQANLQYIVVIFSNQGGVVTKPDAKRYRYLKERVEQIAFDLDIPFWFYAATKEPKVLPAGQVSFRKPATGMWLHFQEDFKQKGFQELDLENSFFVGDAAGRSKDFSDSDLKFATSLGLKFYTPEEFF